MKNKLRVLTAKKTVALVSFLAVIATALSFIVFNTDKGSAYYYCHSETKKGTSIRCITADEGLGSCWGGGTLRTPVVETGLIIDALSDKSNDRDIINGGTCEGLSLEADVYVFDKNGKYIGTQPQQ